MSHVEFDWHPMNRSGFSDVVRGALVRVVLSILVPVVWISLTLIYVAFFAPTFTFFQDFVLVLVSGLGLLAALTVMWVSYGVGVYHRWMD